MVSTQKEDQFELFTSFSFIISLKIIQRILKISFFFNVILNFFIIIYKFNTKILLYYFTRTPEGHHVKNLLKKIIVYFVFYYILLYFIIKLKYFVYALKNKYLI